MVRTAAAPHRRGALGLPSCYAGVRALGRVPGWHRVVGAVQECLCRSPFWIGMDGAGDHATTAGSAASPSKWATTPSAAPVMSWQFEAITQRVGPLGAW